MGSSLKIWVITMVVQAFVLFVLGWFDLVVSEDFRKSCESFTCTAKRADNVIKSRTNLNWLAVVVLLALITITTFLVLNSREILGCFPNGLVVGFLMLLVCALVMYMLNLVILMAAITLSEYQRKKYLRKKYMERYDVWID